jgi:hypothetical protein
MVIRFLLPCTANIDRGAIDAAVEVASSCGAILVPLSLQNTLKTQIVPSESQPPEQNFLDIVRRQAAIMEVPVEWIAMSTHDTGQSIHIFAEEMDCSGILLFVRSGRGVLLETSEVQYVIEHEHIILPFLVHLLPAETTSSPSLWISNKARSRKVATRRKKALPRWYPFALLASYLIIGILIYLNGMYLLAEPVFTLASLLVKLVFIIVIALSLIALLAFFVEVWG